VTVTSLKKFPYDAHPDIAVFLRGFRADVASCLSHLRAIGAKIVYDTDDALDMVPQESPVYWHYISMMGSVITLWEQADLITTTTPRLASHLRTRNTNVLILPNCVDAGEWAATSRGAGRCRVGFQGGETHIADLLLVLEPLKALKGKYEIDFVIQGISPPGKTLAAWHKDCSLIGEDVFHHSSLGEQLSALLASLKGMSYTSVPSVPVDGHPKLLQSLAIDVGLCPLRQGPFNGLKSCLKYYEYAMAGALTIASRVEPFIHEVGFEYTAENTFSSWQEALTRFVTEPRKRTDVAASQRAWVVANRAIESNIRLWEEAYRSL